MSLSPRHEGSGRPVPPHPYRDSAILHGVLAAGIVVVTALTGGAVSRTFGIAAFYFVAATGWSWWRFYERIKANKRAAPRGREPE